MNTWYHWWHSKLPSTFLFSSWIFNDTSQFNSIQQNFTVEKCISKQQDSQITMTRGAGRTVEMNQFISLCLNQKEQSVSDKKPPFVSILHVCISLLSAYHCFHYAFDNNKQIKYFLKLTTKKFRATSLTKRKVRMR